MLRAHKMDKSIDLFHASPFAEEYPLSQEQVQAQQVLQSAFVRLSNYYVIPCMCSVWLETEVQAGCGPPDDLQTLSLRATPDAVPLTKLRVFCAGRMGSRVAGPATLTTSSHSL